MKRTFLTIITIMVLTTASAADKVLVAYFSATGTTKTIAEQIALATNGELLEITPVEPYTAADLNWHDSRAAPSR